jgi:signal peptidase
MWLVRKAASAVVVVLLGVVGIALVASIAFGQPVLLGYVDSGSMEPTLQTGDGYVPVPTVIAGEVSEGDVVVFEAERVDGGGLTVHRVVDETEQGYVTRGDANFVTDQDAGESPVTDGQIVAVALTVNGDVVRIPGLGTGAATVRGWLDRVQGFLGSLVGVELRGDRGFAAVLFLVGVTFLSTEALRSRGRGRERRKSRSRDGIGGKLLILGVASLLVITATLGMLTPAGTSSFELVSAENDPETPRVVEAGGESERPYQVQNNGLLPVETYVHPASEGVSVDQEHLSLGRGESQTVTVTTEAPEELGFYHRSVREYRYLSILPAGIIESLHRLHPLAPVFVIDGLIGLTTIAVGFLLVGSGRIRVRSRSRGGWFS